MNRFNKTGSVNKSATVYKFGGRGLAMIMGDVDIWFSRSMYEDLDDDQLEDVYYGFEEYPDATHVAIHPFEREEWDFFTMSDDPEFFRTYANTKPYIVLSREEFERGVMLLENKGK